MATKTITITEDAYERLHRLKKEGESFSDVIKRIAPETTLDDLVGILSPEQGEELGRIIEEGRKEAEAELDERIEDLTR